DGEMDKYMLALNTLINFPGSWHDIGDIRRALELYEINVDCDIIDTITGYLNDGTFDKNAFLNAWNSRYVGSNVGFLLTDFMFAIEKVEPTAFKTL
ncbi:MAG: hypothetical protein K2M17_05865, partial [Bacilli bacterium]|nr:hypothetical protein [Bacilli bacterium]